MKNVKILSLLLLSLAIASAKAKLSGEISLMADTSWTLSNSSGINIKVKGNENGQFEINIHNLEGGIYNFGKVGEIFLEPDYRTHISLIGQHCVFKGDGEIENSLLTETREQLDKFLGNPGYDIRFNYLITEPSIFIPLLNEYVNRIYLKAEQSSNDFFKNFIKQEAEFGKRYCLYAYTRFYGLDSSKMDDLKKILAIPVADRKENYKKELSAAYLAQFSKKMTSDEKALIDKTLYENWDTNDEQLYKNSNHYKNLIGYRIDYLTYLPENKKSRDSLKNDDVVKLNIAEQLIRNDKIKDDFVFKYTNAAIKKAKLPAEVKSIYESFLKDSKNENYKLDVQKSYQNLTATLANAMAPDFNYFTPEGGMISLKSLRGKYVYIDIWATWCAPCIAEIPSLKKLEERYKNKNICFVSISVDQQAQKQQWLTFVEKNKLKGIQLMADQSFKSDFIKKFGISSIPRFLLIDPEGIIVDNNAKRPSDPELIKQLDTFKL